MGRSKYGAFDPWPCLGHLRRPSASGPLAERERLGGGGQDAAPGGGGTLPLPGVGGRGGGGGEGVDTDFGASFQVMLGQNNFLPTKPLKVSHI